MSWRGSPRPKPILNCLGGRECSQTMALGTVQDVVRTKIMATDCQSNKSTGTKPWNGAHGLGSPVTRQPYLVLRRAGASQPTSIGNILSRQFPGSPTITVAGRGVPTAQDISGGGTAVDGRPSAAGPGPLHPGINSRQLGRKWVEAWEDSYRVVN